ncbi:MAG: complex I NDUFA9 subunit family protein [Alphaproteobacteria bacterium]|nr:complex I NDUFA9 subunit family protein [Alphaproteobacteria bacterium]
MDLQQVTVFGGSGFVGRQVVGRLVDAGARVVVASRTAATAPALAPLIETGRAVAAPCDVSDADGIAGAIEGSDAVVNLVGILYETPKQKFAKLHATAPGLIASAATAAGVERMVHVSAIGAEHAATSHYARSKAAGEAALRAAMAEAVILRPSVIFGPEDDFFNRFADLARWSPVLPLFGGGTNRFQPVYVGDMAAAVYAGLTRDDAIGRLFQLGGPRSYAFRELMAMLLAATGQRRLLLPLPMVLADAIGVAGDLMAALGLKPQLTRDQARLLRTDNVVPDGADGLAALGITATAIEDILPSYLGPGGASGGGA